MGPVKQAKSRMLTTFYVNTDKTKLMVFASKVNRKPANHAIVVLYREQEAIYLWVIFEAYFIFTKHYSNVVATK